MKRSLVLATLCSLALAACQPTGGNDTIKIGFIGPLTGDAAAIGKDMLNGARWAIDEINVKGGINGKQLKLIVEDGRCAGAEAASAAQKLVNVDKVQVIIGGLCSGETLAAAPIAEAGKVVLLSPGSSNPDITKAGDFVFRNYPSDALKTPAMAKYFKDKKYTKVAMITTNADFSQGFRASLKKNVSADKIVFDEVVEPDTKDFRTLLSRLKNVKFDVFFPNPNTDGVLAVLVQQFRDQGFTQPMISHDVAESLTIAEIAGDAAEGFQLINVPAAGEGKFGEDYTAEFGAPQSSITWAAYAYDAANIVVKAMMSGAMDGPAVRDVLYKMSEYTGIVGTYHFDENGDVVGIPFALKEFQDGKIVTVSDIEVD